ncbi:haspin like kinase domain-containing protein [Ditylenchus destructor]|nr:haspin like kinase domain-containing protein [Ditylenchus destructor]
MHGHDCSWPKADDPHRPVIETWEFRCPKYDKIIEAVTEHGTIRFLPMKAPLKKCYSCLIPKENLFDTQTLLKEQKLSLIINLTKFRDLHDPQDFADAKCLMMWLPLSFDKPPSDYKVKKFIKQVNQFAEKHGDCLIGLHCMNGVNETGFMIVSFLVEKCRILLTNAVNDFANARGAGIYRKDFLEELECRYENNKRVLTIPMKPDWVTDRARLPRERQKRMASLWRTYSVHNVSAFPGEFPSEFDGNLTHEMGELYQLCGQTEAKNWDEVINGRHCEKIGEGGFGEVYLLNNKEDAPVILKVIPFCGIDEGKETNGDAMRTVNDIEPELAITKGLSDLGVLQEYVYQPYFTTTFVKHTGYDIVQGEYDPNLLNAWNAYHRDKISENESPSIYGKDPLQFYIVFSAEHAGQPLEDFLKKDFNSINPKDRIDISSSIFYQTAYALAVAEKFGAFEHRDLHVSNILIKSFTAADDVNTIRYQIDGCDYELNPHGFEVKIIDYTLSRMRIDDNVYFVDIGKENIFNGAENDPQANTYREMRNATK